MLLQRPLHALLSAFVFLVSIFVAAALGGETGTTQLRYGDDAAVDVVLNLRPDYEHAPFLHGVASADPLDDAVLIWTRVTLDGSEEDDRRGGGGDDSPIEVRWAAWEAGGDGSSARRRRSFDDPTQSGTATTTPDADYTITVDVTGLEPGRTYHYQFERDGRKSLLGTMKTASRNESVNVAFMSCSSLWSGHLNSLRHLAEDDSIDVVLHLGDWIYPQIDHKGIVRVPYGLQEGCWSESPEQDWFKAGVDAVGGNPDDNADPYLRDLVKSLKCESPRGWLEQYRFVYNLYLLDPDLRASRASQTWINGLDNHDINPLARHPADPDDASRQAAFEWVPQRYSLGTDHDGLPFLDTLRRFRFGKDDLVDVIVLDTYTYSGNETMKEKKYGLLGEGQHQWLDTVLAESSQDNVPWRVIVSGKTFMPFVINNAGRAVSRQFAWIASILAILVGTCVLLASIRGDEYRRLLPFDVDELKAIAQEGGAAPSLSRDRLHSIERVLVDQDEYKKPQVIVDDDDDDEEDVFFDNDLDSWKNVRCDPPPGCAARCCVSIGVAVLAVYLVAWVGTTSALNKAFNPPTLKTLNPDPSCWEGHMDSLTRLFDQMDDTRTNVDNIWLTGDMHYSYASDVFRFDTSTKEILTYRPNGNDKDWKRYGVEMIAGSASRSNLDEVIGGVSPLLRPGTFLSRLVGVLTNRVIAAANRHYRYFQGQEHGYGVVQVTSTHITAQFVQFPVLERTDAYKIGKTMYANRGENKWTFDVPSLQ